MVTAFSKSANHPKEIVLTICNCFRLMRDWKLENLANGKEISTVPFDGKVSRQSWAWHKLSQGKEGAVIERVKSHRSKHLII